MNSQKVDVLENRAICMNKVHDYINNIVPKLHEEFKKGFKLTNSFDLFKKDKERIYKVIDSLLPKQKGNFPTLRAFLKVNEYSISLEVDDNYIVTKHEGGGATVNYYKKWVYIWNMQEGANDFKPLEMVSKEELEKAEVRLEELQKEKDKIQNEIYDIERLLN